MYYATLGQVHLNLIFHLDKSKFCKYNISLQFHGAFKRYFKTHNERELERRWIRINRIPRCDMNLVCIKHETTSSLGMKRTMKSQSYRKPFKNLIQIGDDNVVCSPNRHTQSVDDPYDWGMIFPFLIGLFCY